MVVRVVVAVAVVVAVVIAEAVVAEAVVIDQKVSPENPDLREKDAVAIVVAVAVVTDQELLYPLHQLVKASRVPSMKVVCPNALKDLKDVVVSVVDVVNVVPDMKANLVKKTTH